MPAQNLNFDNDPNRLLSPKSAATYTGLSEATIRRWILHRLIPVVKFGGAVRIRKGAIDAYVEARIRTTALEAAS